MTRPYEHKIVRDLAWCFKSPQLISNDSGLDLITDEWCKKVTEPSETWLEQLDEDPSHLIDWMQKQNLYIHKIQNEKTKFSTDF